MSDINNANETLMNLIFTALDHGIDSIKASGGPLVPFLMTETNGDKKLERFVTEQLEEGQAMAKKHLVELNKQPDFAVIASDGYVTIENQKFDAVLVEGFDKNDKQGYVLAQRYKPKKLFSKFTSIGNAAYIGDTEQLLKKDDPSAPIDATKLHYYFTIMFKENGIDLKAAAEKFTASNLTVNERGPELEVSWGGPKMYVRFFSGEDVTYENNHIGEGTEFENDLKESNSRFQVAFENLDEVMDEINTLIEVQGILQELTDGIIYRSWNQSLGRE